MKNGYKTIKTYCLISIFMLSMWTSWGQQPSLKRLTATQPEQVLKSTQKEAIKELTILPKAKALLQSVAATRDTTKQHKITSLEDIFGQAAIPFPKPPAVNNFKNKYKVELEIARDQQDVPIFIKGKQNQRLTTIESSNSRSINYEEIAIDFLKEYQEVLQLTNPAEEFKEKEVITDPQGNTHIKLQQYWQDIPVWNSQVVVHARPKGVYAFNGRYHPNVTFSTTQASISAIKAVDLVKDLLGRENCEELPALQKLLPHKKFTTSALVYYVPRSTTTAQLAWQIEIHTKDFAHWLVMVDANNGQVLYKVNQACSFNGPTTATAKDMHGVTQTINTYDNGEKYYLVDGSRPMFDATSVVPSNIRGAIITGDIQLSDSLSNLKHITSPDNTWDNPAAVSAHHHAGICYEYFLKTFDRNSIDGKGGEILSIINGPDEDNASWANGFIVYGNGKEAFTEGSLAKSLDIGAHEMTHGVIRNSADFERAFQADALNESFADVFGVMIDREDWLLGEDVINTDIFVGGALRNLQDPNNGVARGQDGWQPKHISEYLHVAIDEDRGGGHTNSGIPNHAFYLFATTIGKDKAEQVYYKALTQYLIPKSQFIDCRLAVIAAAEELYGAAEATAAAEAFDAVGILGDSATPLEDLPAVEGLQYLLTQVVDQDTPLIAEYDFEEQTYFLKSSHQFNPRLSVDESGQVGLFVGSDGKVYVLDLTDPNPATNTNVFLNTGEDGTSWHKVAISPDATKVALLAYPYEPIIIVLDLETDNVFRFQIGSTNPRTTNPAPEYLDMIQFDPTSQYMIYDAYNEPPNVEGFWDIGIINIWDNATNEPADGQNWKPFTTLPRGINIGNPMFAHTSASRIVYEVFNLPEGISQIMTRDFATHRQAVIATNNSNSDFSVTGLPCFSPNDDYIAYTTNEGEEQNYVTLQALEEDKISPLGTNAGVLFGESPMWYARGERNFEEPRGAFSAINKSGIAPLTVSFKDESTNRPLIWSWTFPGGTPNQSNERNPIITYEEPGNYRVTLRVSNETGDQNVIKLGYVRVTADPNCAIPTGLATASVGYSHIQLTWDESSDNNYYQTRVRVQDGPWNEGSKRANEPINWVSVPPCTTYEVQIRGGCPSLYGNTASDYSSSIFVNTPGCEDPYCYSFGQPWDNWIQKVTFHNLVQESGDDLGYGNYTNASANLEREQSYGLFIEPNYETDTAAIAYYSAWIDFNQDNDFEDDGEQVMEALHDNSQTLQAKIRIPSAAKSGSTRMRISVNRDQIPNPCDRGAFSEVEDYTVVIEDITTALTLNASPAEMTLPAETGMATLAVTSNTNWTAHSNDRWIQLSPMEGVNDGTLAITYESNPMTIGRVAIITIHGEGGVESKEIMLIQDGAKTTISPTDPSNPITYVNQLATGNDDGTSWKDAYTNLRTAMSSTTSGEIWVAAGTYLPTQDGDQTISFELQANVSLFGGFNTTGNPTWEDRDWEKYPTILSGDIGTEDYNEDNTFHVLVVKSRTTFDNTVDGFTITGGNSDYSGGGAELSGTYNLNSVCTFRNCFFTNNYSGYEGGAVSGDLLTLKIENCLFEDNYADYTGGAVNFFGGHTPTTRAQLNISDCIFRYNETDYEAGAVHSYGFSRIIRSEFIENHASYAGGAIDFFSGHSPTQITQLHVLNCLFDANTTDYEGGAVGSSGLSRIIGSLFIDNVADNEGGAISHSREDSLLVTNCTFAYNIAGRKGAAISNFSWDSTFTFIANSVFYENVAGNNELFDFSGRGIHAKIAHSFIDAPGCSAAAAYCDAGMIFNETSPFIDAESNDFQPTQNGLLVNNGNNDYLIPNLLYDLAGNPRISGDQIDIGAYEAVLLEGAAPQSITAITRNNSTNYTANLFPNPTRQHSTIQLSKVAATDITGMVSNINGQIIQQFVIPQGQMTHRIALKDYPSGVYWAKLMVEGMTMPAMKLVVFE